MNINLEEVIKVGLEKLEKTFSDEDKEFNRRMVNMSKQNKSNSPPSVNWFNRVEDTPYGVSTPTDSGRADFQHPAPCLMFELLSCKCYGKSLVVLTDNI